MAVVVVLVLLAAVLQWHKVNDTTERGTLVAHHYQLQSTCVCKCICIRMCAYLYAYVRVKECQKVRIIA